MDTLATMHDMKHCMTHWQETTDQRCIIRCAESNNLMTLQSLLNKNIDRRVNRAMNDFVITCRFNELLSHDNIHDIILMWSDIVDDIRQLRDNLERCQIGEYQPPRQQYADYEYCSQQYMMACQALNSVKQLKQASAQHAQLAVIISMTALSSIKRRFNEMCNYYCNAS